MIVSLLFSLLHAANAEEQAILEAIDLQSLEEYATKQSFDFSEWLLSALSGEFEFSENLASLLELCKTAVFEEMHGVFASVIIPASVLLMLKLLIPKGASAQRTAAFVCRLSCIASLASIFARMQTVAENLMQEFVMFSNALTPALIAASTLSGAESTATFLTPISALCANLIQNLLSKWGIAIGSAAAGIAIAGSLSMNVSLKRLQEWIKRLLHWGTGGLLAAFTSILSLQGRMSAARDSAASRTAKYAIENLIPVIGGNVSDTLDSLLSTANVIRNALGCSGLMLLVYICIVPMSKLLGTTLLLHLAAAIAEPLGDDSLTTFTGQFADSVEMLLIICTAAAVLCTLLIGSCMGAAISAMR